MVETEGPRILVVDDERHIVEVLARRLNRDGYEVATASNIAEAMKLASENPPALIITDLQMPGGTGLDLAKSIRTHPRLHKTPIVLLSARGFLADVSRLKTLDIARVMEKPFSSRKVSEEIGRILGESPKPRENRGDWLNHPNTEAA